ncbi:hypothetical protein C5B85_10915 [Pseudoclavibacter sp. AY1F1]|uniref:hypothetical protein n=1 Tax=Pseudoclavibacter sp. AY1F1 TaxID=2080583 RepID=UPI000CE9223B|nr:hypothetical protein [Pseudoclavibacter sp. AY1F1]PPF44149.1 hypothetical protein C5B85_10915 [Pseudoclavibacter sp. AY1F1]
MTTNPQLDHTVAADLDSYLAEVNSIPGATFVEITPENAINAIRLLHRAVRDQGSDVPGTFPPTVGVVLDASVLVEYLRKNPTSALSWHYLDMVLICGRAAGITLAVRADDPALADLDLYYLSRFSNRA